MVGGLRERHPLMEVSDRRNRQTESQAKVEAEGLETEGQFRSSEASLEAVFKNKNKNNQNLACWCIPTVLLLKR